MHFGEYELSPSLIGLSLYTHLIGKLFNAYPFGPPSRVTGTSTWTCVDHSVSRLPPVTKNALFGLAFAAAAGVVALNLATDGNS